MASREQVKWLLFPGINLHARLRWHLLPCYFSKAAPGEDRSVLDAGCGNGMLAYQSYRLGNRVLAVSIKSAEVAGCQRLFNRHLAIPEERLRFEVRNLHDIKQIDVQFDEIICSETLEHIRDDRSVCAAFYDLLKPNGILHLCAPYAEHPEHKRRRLDPSESGDHVRAGYTPDSYRQLLEPLGFTTEEYVGLGGPTRQWFNRNIIRAERLGGFGLGFMLFVLASVVVWLDPATPPVPYSLYVRAVKLVAPSNRPRP